MDFDERRRLRNEFMTNRGRNTRKATASPVPYRHEPSPDTDFGEYLKSQYPIISLLLKCLPCADLIRASQTCRDFMYAAETELANRSMLCASEWAGFGLVSSLSAFETFKDSIYGPTSFTLFFCTDNPTSFFLRKGTTNYPLYARLKEYLASIRTPMLTVVSELGIVGTTSDLVVVQEGPLVNNSISPFATVITIPKMQGLEMHKFGIKYIHAQKIMTIDHKKRPDWLRQRIKGPNRPIKCIFFFVAEGIPIEPGVMFKALQNRQDEKLVVGGAFVPPADYTYNETRKRFGIEGVAFYGDNVQASSLALTLAHKTPEDVDVRMKEFADGVKRGKTNATFMFTCCGRGLVSGRSTERTFFDSEAYQKYFPTTPLHGIIGLGEIGCDWFPMENGVAKSKFTDTEWIRTFVQQQYASVFVHLAFGLDTYEDKLQSAHQTAVSVMAERFGTQPDLDVDDQLDDTPKAQLMEAGDSQANAGGLPYEVDGPGTSGESGR